MVPFDDVTMGNPWITGGLHSQKTLEKNSRDAADLRHYDAYVKSLWSLEKDAKRSSQSKE